MPVPKRCVRIRSKRVGKDKYIRLCIRRTKGKKGGFSEALENEVPRKYLRRKQ